MERLTEKSAISIKTGEIKPLPMTENSSQLVDGKEYKSVGAYTVEVSRYDYKNRNGRVYSKRLWENVINTQRNIYEGCAGLMDHPENAPSVKDIFCVWHNPRIKESNQTVIADMYLVGDGGRKAKEFLDAGGKLEVSSSGFGDILSDGSTVDESTYLIERIADWVFDASQEVFATKEDEITESITKSVENSLSEIDEDCKKSSTNIIELTKSKREKLCMNEKQLLMQMREYVAGKFKQASKAKSLVEKKSAYVQLLNYIAGDDNFLKEKAVVDSKLKEIEKEFVKIEEKASTVPRMEEKNKKTGETLKALQSKYEMAAGMLDEAKEAIKLSEKKADRLKKLYQISQAEKNSMVTADEFLEADEKHKREMAKLLRERKVLKERTARVRPKRISEKKEIGAREKMKRIQPTRVKSVLEEKNSSRINGLRERTVERQTERKPFVERRPERRFERRPERRFEPEVDILEEKQRSLLEATGMIQYITEQEIILDWYKDVKRGNPMVEKIEDFILSAITLQEAKERLSTYSFRGNSENYSSKSVNESVLDRELGGYVNKKSFTESTDSSDALSNVINLRKKESADFI